MKRTLYLLCGLTFLLVSAGIIWFLLQFTESDPAYTYPVWEEAAVVTAAGDETAFDATGLPPALDDGAHYRFTTTLPSEREDGTWMIFETAGMDVTVTLDGDTLWQSTAVQDAATVNMSQAQLPLPAGGGERLTMTVTPLAETALLPPLLRLSLDPTDQAGAIAYANHYGISSGVAAVAAALLWGLFLLGLAQKKANLRLLLPFLAALTLMAHGLSLGYGNYFLPEWVQAIFSQSWMNLVAPLALLLFLILQRTQDFWLALLRVTLWSLAGLAVAVIVSHLRGGYLARYLNEQIAALQTGYYNNLLYWFTLWLILVCTLLAAWTFVRSTSETQAQAQALALKNALILENVQSLEEKIRSSAAEQHEFNHRLTALETMLAAGDLDGATESLARWRKSHTQTAQLRFSANLTLNAILQNAAARAETAGIAFQTTVVVPERLPIPDEDLCILLMNLLDNAIEGAARTPADQEKHIRLQMRCTGGHLAIFCENSYDGKIASDHPDHLRSRKGDALLHGFGLAQMRQIAEKYGSILDVRPGDTSFTVQTALLLPKES